MSKRLTTEEIEKIRKNAKEASELPFTAWSVCNAVCEDIPRLIAEIEALRWESRPRVARREVVVRYKPYEEFDWDVGY